MVAQMPKFETKRINLIDSHLSLVEDEPQTMQFSGYAAVFNNVDSYGDMIAPGAFSAFLSDIQSGKQQWPAMLTQHGGFMASAEDLMPIGVYTELKEDKTGLMTTGILADTDRGDEAYKLMKMAPRPAINGLSIGYYVREESYGGKNDNYQRLLKKIDILEISLVTFPANDKARIDSVKNYREMDERELERTLRDVLGLSQKEAKTVIASGFKSLRNNVDVESQELKQIYAHIERINNILV
jgi:uncharacterized protein